MAHESIYQKITIQKMLHGYRFRQWYLDILSFDNWSCRLLGCEDVNFPTGIFDDLQLYHWILIDLKKIFDQIQVKNLDFGIPNRRLVVNQAKSCGWLWLDRGSEMVPKWLNGCRLWLPSDMSFGSSFRELYPPSKFINRNRIVNNRFYYRLWGYHEV